MGVPNSGENRITYPGLGLWAVVGENSARLIKLNPSSHGMLMMNIEDHEIQEGNHYYIEGYATLGNTDTMYVRLTTPDTGKYGRFGWRITSSGILTTTLVENPTGGLAGGSSVAPLNNNRNSNKQSAMVIKRGATACTGGKIISQEAFGSKFGGGEIARSDMIILKRNATYCRTMLSGAAANIISFKASWWESSDID